MDYKKTVNLPSTGFPMKANLPAAEPKLLEKWGQDELYDRIREARKGQPTFILHDGPPYANGDIHLGHALNKLLKDFIVKFRTMQGYDSPYVPGWDCHGLPIEIKVDSQLGPKKAQMTQKQIRKVCRDYAQKFVDKQSRQFQRLGVFGRWDDPYLTMSAEYQSVIARAFVDFLDRGYVYKGLKPVNWCISCQTALAEAEVEYENHTSPSIWVAFRMIGEPAKLDARLAGRTVSAVIWTTTPWTIPANVAIAFHPKLEYSAVEVNGQVYIAASELVKQTAEAAGWAEPVEIARFKGEQLEGTEFAHPLFERVSVGVIADYVTLEQGTGAVHTAPGHGMDDYLTGQRYGLPTFCPVDGQGRFFPAEGASGKLPEQILGQTVWEANPVVVGLLREAGALLAERPLHHSYPHCWRCHNPTIFRATEQWFIGMDRNNLRASALEAIRQVKWHPAWGEERISNMIATRPDWCISRQRVWGVPIVVFYCADCNECITDRKYLDPVVDLFARETADVWYEKSAAELLGEGVRCAKCGSGNFRKETDILDVWFDSGSSHLAVLSSRYGLPWPSDMYLEGGDQYRGWFHSSLLVGVGLRGSAPYRGCATNGWTLDENGKAMSKSLGNVIDPAEIIKDYGADVLRLWVASVEFTEDVTLSQVILQRLSEAYRKMRNTFRYALGNLHDFDPAGDAVPGQDLAEIDQWILRKTAALVERVTGFYEQYAFHRVYQALYNFSTVELSAVYFDILKDRLYTTAPRSPERRSAQTALWRVSSALVRLAAPLLAFTCEEVWAHMKRPAGSPGSVHLALFPQPEELLQGLAGDGAALVEDWDRLLGVRERVLKALESARNEKLIGASLEARVVLDAGEGLYPLLSRYGRELPSIFIVSEVAVRPGPEIELGVTIERTQATKCERCWKYTFDTGADPLHPPLCAACAHAVRTGWTDAA